MNTHKGLTQSRRDDLESIGYLLIFLHRGRLPWQGIKAASRKEKHLKICEAKSRTPLAELCAKQQMLARIHRAFLWQQPSGPLEPSAYDLTQLLLCRRAKSLAARYRATGEAPRAWLARHELRCADSLEAAGIRFD